MANQDELSPLSSGDREHSAVEEAPATAAAARQPPRKRRRVVISCTECHRRKQKCDRNLPCTNCVSRNKQDSCRYETGAPTAQAAQQHRAGDDETVGSVAVAASGEPAEHAGDSAHRRGKSRPSKYDMDPKLVASQGGVASVGSLTSPGAGASGGSPVTFGYVGNGASTMGFLKKIDDGQAQGESLSHLAMGRETTAYFGTRERYKSLVRQLPARPYVEKLVDMYFKDSNWQYNGVDRYWFERQMEEWYNLPFNVLNVEGPQALSPDLRAFPAMVFEMVATTLLMLGTDPDPTFDSLKYTSSMTFEDLANDYAESGMAILNLLGKRQVSFTYVSADWLRAAYLKYAGLVTESWHAIGTAIRDAQECGLHRESLDPKPKSDKLEDILENQWEIQRRRKVWCLLVVWDVHTGLVLGRPLSVDTSQPCTLPVDAPEPKDPSRTPVVPRSENDPPCLTTRMAYVFRISLALKDIADLEKEGPCPKDFSKVDRLHESLVELEAQTPAYFRKENPDTRFDDLPECSWVPMVRASLHPLVAFNFMALHRPYVFTRPHSRREALKASLQMLELQRANFASMNPRHYKLFQLFFGTFDAIVLMASIFILFPKDNAEYLPAALQHFQWAMERFEAMSDRNRLAAAARGVLQAIHTRLKRALGISGAPNIAPTTSSTPNSLPTTTEVHQTTSSESSSLTNSGYNSNDARSTSIFTTPGAETSSSTSEQPFGTLGAMAGHTNIDPGLSGVEAGDWNLPGDFDWGSIQPVYAMADVAYNDLMGIVNTAETMTSASSIPSWAGGAPLLNNGAITSGAGDAPADPQGWLFGGDFGNDSVWSVLNQYPASS